MSRSAARLPGAAAMAALPAPAPADRWSFLVRVRCLAKCVVLTAYGLDCSVRICFGKCVRFFNRIVFQKGRY